MEPSATVAVLFCDVVGSTARQVRLGDVRADDHRRRLFALLEGAVSTSDGLVVKTLGDGLMAVFQRSTVSALECAATMHSIAQGFDPEDPLELRVGVSVGEVLEEDGDWFGTPVVEAARLCDAAGDGRTLAHALVASLVGSRATGFSFVERGERTLKGLSEPTPVVTVMASEDHGIVRSGPESVKRTDGKAIAMRRTVSVIAAVSARSDLRNLSRAGTDAKRSRTSTTVPRVNAAGFGPVLRPLSRSITWASSP